ncbi:MAG: acetyl-CoA carboxylase carboxyl transferase subunit beta, partial [Campylobacter sp.]
MNFGDLFSKIRRTQPAPSEAPTHWIKCPGCGALMYSKEVEQNHSVCPKCNYHLRFDAQARIDLICDEGSFVEY